MSRKTVLFIAAMLTFWIIGLSTGISVFYLQAIVIALMLGIGLISAVAGLLSVRVTIGCAERTVPKGKSIQAMVTVWYLSPLPVKTVQVRLALPEGNSSNAEVEVPVVPFRKNNCRLELLAAHRGVYPLGLQRICVRDVFGMWALKLPKTMTFGTVEVLPRARKLPILDLAAADMSSSALTRLTEDNASPSDIRQWVQGDALKKVHWKLSMRRQELMVRTYEESIRPDTLILLDLYPLNIPRKHALTVEDALCETAAAMARSRLEADYPVRMPLMSAQPTEISGASVADIPAFVTALSRVRFNGEYPFEKVCALEMRRMQRVSGVILVSSHLTPRMVDFIMQLQQTGIQTTMCWITDSHREEENRRLARLRSHGIRAWTIDPWGEGLTPNQVLGKDNGNEQ